MVFKKEYFYVILSAIMFGFIVFGGQVFANLGLSLYEISFIPQLLVVIILLPFILLNKNLRILRGKKSIWILYGFSSALAIVLEFVGVVMGVPVAIVLLLLYAQPLWTIIITYFFLNEKIRKIDIIAGILVVLGVVFLVNPFDISKIEHPLGIILSAFGGIALSVWVVIGSVVSKKESPPVTTRFTNALLTSFFLLLAYPLFKLVKDSTISSLSFNFSASIWIWLIIFAIIIEIGSHIFYFMGTRKVPTVIAGIIILLEPIVGTILAAIFLSQAITSNIVLGGIFILIGNYLVIKK